jgi:hypothetical protein
MGVLLTCGQSGHAQMQLYQALGIGPQFSWRKNKPAWLTDFAVGATKFGWGFSVMPEFYISYEPGGLASSVVAEIIGRSFQPDWNGCSRFRKDGYG